MEFNPKRLSIQLQLAATSDSFICKTCKKHQQRSQFTAYNLVAPEATRRCKGCTSRLLAHMCRVANRTLPPPEPGYTVFDAIMWVQPSLYDRWL